MPLVLLVLAQAACLLVLAATAWAAGWAAWGWRAPERLLHPLTPTIGLALLGSVGLLLAALHAFRPAALLAVAVAAHLAALPGWRLLLAAAMQSIRRAPRRALVVVLLIAAAAAGGFVVGLFPPTAFDETTYHLSLARAFAAGGGLPWVPELRVPTFPVFGEALQAALLLGWGERGAHQVALLATLLTAALLLAWGREAESVEVGWLAAALFLGSPLVAYLAGTGYVDPLVGLFATGAFYALWRGGGDDDDRVAWPALAGVLAGGAAAVKYLGLYAVLVGALAMVVRLLLRRPPPWRALLGFAAGVLATTAIPYGNLIWRTGNPLFPFFTGLFGASGWEPPPALAILYRHSIVLLPYNAVFHRELAGEQPPLSPALLIGLVMLAVAAVAVPRLRLGALVVAGFFPAYLALPVVSRYLLTVLPLWCLLVALALAWAWRRARGAPPSRRAAALLAVGLALPGPAYGAFYLAQRGAVPASPRERVDYLAAAHPGYRALHWLQRRQGSRYVARCAACEHLHGLATGRLLGEHSGPWAYYRLDRAIANPVALQRLLRADGVQYLLLPRAAAASLRGSAARGRFTLLYADGEYEVWRVTP
jgi:4-amino-4-deoxy-L-arabinose transferase-like glycosyltransferase